MGIKIKSNQINCEDGFSQLKDIFGRQEFGKQLSNIIVAMGSPSTLILDAPWGTGKSSFIKMWAGAAQKSGTPVIYFDAFENDYQSDGFLALSSEFIAKAKKLGLGKSTKTDDAKNKIVAVAKIVGLASAKIGLKAATAGLLEFQDLRGVIGDVSKTAGDEISEVIGKLVEERLASHEQDKATFQSLRETFSDLVVEMVDKANEARSTDLNQTNGNVLVFIIDELDRCKPPFAMDLLEKMKHLFSVPNVVFILVCSITQFSSYLKVIYGDIDSKGYLEKFYNLRVSLPVNAIGNNEQETIPSIFLNHLGCPYEYIRLLSPLLTFKAVGLRTIERIYTLVCIARISSERRFSEPTIISILCAMNVLDFDLYCKCRTKSAKIQQISEFAMFSEWKDNPGSVKSKELAEYASTFFKYCLKEQIDDTAKQQMDRKIFEYGILPENIIPYFCKLIDGIYFT